MSQYLKNARCSDMGTGVSLIVGRYIPQFTQLLMKYVARADGLSLK